jgi:precorrin-3B synthase
MNKPEAKGWCPSALMPMMSGDGLLVRIKPAFSRLTSHQAQIIALLSKRHGNGFMDITNRANLQIRGLKQSDYPLMLKDLQDSGIVETHEARDGLNLILAPFTDSQSVGWRCAEALYNAASAFPALPSKFGFAIDCGATRYLQHASCDIRVEIDESGQLLIRLDGCKQGYVTSEETFQSDILQALHWFVSSQNKKRSYNRMHHLVAYSDVPDIFTTTTPCKNTKSLYPGCEEDWYVIAVPFGQITADQLLEIADQTQEIIFSINRCLVIDKTAALGKQFITLKDDLRYHVTACAGMPACTSASIITKQLASKICESQVILAGKSYHISGCSKGCAMPSNSDICIIGERGSYNMLENGCAWDKPSYTSLSESALMDALLNLQI